ncbi:MAG TPA: polyhydroxyalkanoate synthesis protein PhaF [Actinomycetes bacterium]|nr:polyhydroxyalkanoate synthesis protein PhaF [Actinomycetes bacterium]
MVLDGLRGYIQLASGLTDVTRARAQAAAKALVAQGEAVVPPPMRAQVSSLTDDLLATSRANRDLLVSLVRTEVERSVARLGLVAAHELEAAARLIRALEGRVEELEQELLRAQPAARKTTARKTTAKKAAKKATTKKSTARKSTAKKTAKKSTAKKST